VKNITASENAAGSSSAVTGSGEGRGGAGICGNSNNKHDDDDNESRSETAPSQPAGGGLLATALAGLATAAAGTATAAAAGMSVNTPDDNSHFPPPPLATTTTRNSSRATVSSDLTAAEEEGSPFIAVDRHPLARDNSAAGPTTTTALSPPRQTLAAHYKTNSGVSVGGLSVRSIQQHFPEEPEEVRA